MGCILEYATTDHKGYHQYKSNPEDYAVCPLREVCFSKKQKVITHHIWEKYKDIARKKQTNSYREKVLQSTLFNYRAKLCGRQRTTWLSICSISEAEVCPNAGLSHRNLSKHEKIALHLTKKGLVEGYFLKLYYFMLFLFTKIKNKLIL